MATASGAHNSSGLEGSDHFLDAFKWELRDERADGWLLLSSVWPTVALSSTYVLLVTVVGPWFMRNRKAYDVKPVLIVYNAIQILISLYLLYGMSVHGWMTGEYSTSE